MAEPTVPNVEAPPAVGPGPSGFEVAEAKILAANANASEPTVPNVEAPPAVGPGPSGFEVAEAKILAANANASELSNKETSQRILLRWIAVGMALSIIVFMACVFGHSVHQITRGYVDTSNSSVGLALVVGPIASITTITLAFFVGAFRKFEDKDGDKALKGVNSGISLFQGEG